jgi:signal transduction histidine kinase
MASLLPKQALREGFVTALTHDLRNPLSNAYAYAELINSAAELAQAVAQGVIDNRGRMYGMIQDLLDSVKFQTGVRLHLRLEEFDIQELVKEVRDQFRVSRTARAFNLLAIWLEAGGTGRQSKGQLKILLAMQ